MQNKKKPGRIAGERLLPEKSRGGMEAIEDDDEDSPNDDEGCEERGSRKAVEERSCSNKRSRKWEEPTDASCSTTENSKTNHYE